MSGKRITIRRGVGKSNTPDQEAGVSAYAKAVQDATPNVAQATASLEAFGRTILNTAFRNPGGAVDGPSRPPPAPPEGTVTGRMSSSAPSMSNIPRSDLSRTVIGVDLASGPDVTGSYLIPTGIGDASLSAMSLHDSINMESVSDTLAREISRRLAVSLDNEMLAGYTARTSMRERGVPVVQVDYRYETMVTHIMLRVWLMGPNQPHTGAGCSISDEEVADAYLSSDSEYSAASHIRGLIVERLNDALATEVRRTVERVLDAAMATDEGARRQMTRIFTRQSLRG